MIHAIHFFFLRRKLQYVRQEEYHCLLRHYCQLGVPVIIRFGARASRVSGEMHKAFLIVSVFSLAYAVQKLFGLGRLNRCFW